ncbi:MAG: endonuclease MutS2 [Clostridia bacterium]|nr:endonuclease MutS2 [Clostridia bacterium]
MEQKTLKTLEYDKILELLCGFAKNEATAVRILALTPSSDFRQVEQTLAETDSAVTLILKYGMPELLRIQDVKEQVKRLSVGGTLNMPELLNLARILKNARTLKSLTPEQSGVLSGYIEELTPHKTLEDRINGSILSDEEMADHASPELASIRRKTKNASAKIKDSLDSMIRSGYYQKFLQDTIVTMRNNRYVVPVKAEHRSDVRGIVHDISASGSTVFIEPESVVNANNELHELEIKEKTEIARILAELSAMAAEVSEELLYNFDTLIHLDFVFAKAKLALDMKAIHPLLNKEDKVFIKDGRHPLIDRKKIVPTTVYLGDTFDSLIVTGPNTGGKTVVLKTVGLFSLMTQSGLFIPASDSSTMPVFHDIFADIGDEQSIEQSLSTFSSHMKNIVRILERVEAHCLVLFDELGAGTDPTEGAALATAILEHIQKMGAKCVATTHYSELKLYALSTSRVENASCEFDVETLSPTYRLLIGTPGKSNAFAISGKLGLSPAIIARSKELLTEENLQFEDVLSSIEKNRLTAERDSEETRRMRDEIETLKRQLEDEREKIEKQKDKIFDRAREKADKILSRAQAETEELLAAFKQAQKEKNEQDALKVMTELRRELGLKQKKNRSPKEKQKPVKKAGIININSLKLGATVQLDDIGDKGSVLAINKKDNTVQVQVGIMKITSKIENLTLLEDEETDSKQGYTPRQKGGTLRSGTVKSEIDLRGMLLEEALLETDKFLDEASMAGLNSVSIIHGKGTGTLRNGITQMLRKHPQVKSFRLGKYGEGENGVTIAELK